MQLVKPIRSDRFAEDFGLSDGGKVYLYDYCMECNYEKTAYKPIPLSRLEVSPVIRVNAAWLDKPVKIRCNIADTYDKKIEGLQRAEKLREHEGMYFPYIPYEKVSMHQASVPFSLDIMFIQDDHVCKIVDNTKVGSRDIWSWDYCTGVIEVAGGYCSENNIKVGDRITIWPVSEQDVVEVAEENARLAAIREEYEEDIDSVYEGQPNVLHVISSIVDSL